MGGIGNLPIEIVAGLKVVTPLAVVGRRLEYIAVEGLHKGHLDITPVT